MASRSEGTRAAALAILLGCVPMTRATTTCYGLPGCAAWFDGAATGTVTLSPGGGVAQWADRSGSGVQLAQRSSAAAQPLYSHGGVVFSGAQSLSTPLYPVDFGGVNTLCLVLRDVAGGFFAYKSATPATPWDSAHDNRYLSFNAAPRPGAMSVAGTCPSVGSSQVGSVYAGSGFPGGGVHSVCVRKASADGQPAPGFPDGIYELYADGALLAAGNDVARPIGADAGSSLTLGGPPPPGVAPLPGFVGTLLELVHFSGAGLSAADVASLSAALLAKWR